MNHIKLLTYSGYLFGALGCAAALAATSHTVTQAGKTFSEKKMNIAVGDSIVFKNDDKVKHNILVKDLDYNSGMQEPGSESMVTFDKAGKFSVRCGIHPKMKIKVKVE